MFNIMEIIQNYAVYSTLFSSRDAENTRLIDPKQAQQERRESFQLKRAYEHIMEARQEGSVEFYRTRLENALRDLDTKRRALESAKRSGHKNEADALTKQFQDAFSTTKVMVDLGKHYAPGGNPFTISAQSNAQSLGLG